MGSGACVWAKKHPAVCRIALQMFIARWAFAAKISRVGVLVYPTTGCAAAKAIGIAPPHRSVALGVASAAKGEIWISLVTINILVLPVCAALTITTTNVSASGCVACLQKRRWSDRWGSRDRFVETGLVLWAVFVAKLRDTRHLFVSHKPVSQIRIVRKAGVALRSKELEDLAYAIKTKTVRQAIAKKICFDVSFAKNWELVRRRRRLLAKWAVWQAASAKTQTKRLIAMSIVSPVFVAAPAKSEKRVGDCMDARKDSNARRPAEARCAWNRVFGERRTGAHKQAGLV